MPDRRHSIEARVLSATVSHLRPDQYQWRPYFPDLLNQPRLLICPKPGKLVAVYVYNFRRRMTWQSTLAALEDLFEVKISLGERTLTAGVALNDDLDEETREMAALLNNTFDVFIEGRDGEVESLGRRLRKSISASKVGIYRAQIWNTEKKFVTGFLKDFKEEKLREFVDKSYKPRLERGALSSLAETALRQSGYKGLQVSPLVTSIKTTLGQLKGVHRLRFNFRIPGEPTTLIDVLQSERYGSREKLRCLMAKARLVRYEVHHGQIERIHQAPRLLLFVDGNLAGPDHDPFRYVRALSSVGWEIIRVDQRNTLARTLHAHV